MATEIYLFCRGLDRNAENLFHLDFRLNVKWGYRKLVQSSRLNRKWAYMSRVISDLPDFAKENEVYIRVTDTHYEVTINNIAVTPRFPVHLTRFPSFKTIMLAYSGKCIRIDKNASYMKNGG